MKKERIIVDTNIIIDVFAKREGFYETSYKLLKLCENGDIIGCITASTVTDIYYLIRKYADRKTADDALGHLLNIFTVIDVTGEDVVNAYLMHSEDYEDCLLGVCAARAGINRIVSRDKRGFKTMDI